jgi:hypothetical protein
VLRLSIEFDLLTTIAIGSETAEGVDKISVSKFDERAGFDVGEMTTARSATRMCLPFRCRSPVRR